MTIRWCVLTGAFMIAAIFLVLQSRLDYSGPPGITTRWWNGTLSVEETYYPDGSLLTRTEYGDDGMTVLKFQSWGSKTRLMVDKTRLADGKMEERLFYPSGDLGEYRLWLGDESATLLVRIFAEDGSVYRRSVQPSRRDRATQEEFFDREGIPVIKRENDGYGNHVTKVLEDGKVRFTQTGSFYDFVVEELRDDGTLARRLKVLNLEAVQSQHFRPDGTLKLTRNLEGGRVTSQVELDTDGKTVLVESEHGEPEEIDPRYLEWQTIDPGEDL